MPYILQSSRSEGFLVLETLLTNYGYPVVIAGAFFEGETIMVLGGFAAHLGYLSLDWVIACGFCGTLLSDQLYFFLGRRHGKALLERRHSWQARTEQVFRKLDRHQDLLILGFRFLYGLRTVTPFAIGIRRVSYLRFTVLNVIGAGIWATATGLSGYYFGRAVEAMLGDIKRYELELMMIIVVFGMLIWLIHVIRQRRDVGSHP